MAIYKGNQKIDGGYPIATEISSSSTNSEVAGAKAVYDITPKTIAVLKLGGNSIDNSFTISSVTTSYTPLNITTMTAIKTDTDYCTYNSSNGRLTFKKSCTLKATFSTQMDECRLLMLPFAAAVPQGDDMLAIMREAGFENCKVKRLTLGTCSIYTGERLL